MVPLSGFRRYGYNGTAEIQFLKQKVLVVYREISEVQPYADAIRAAGGEPLLKEAVSGLQIGSCDRLLLTGGDDINPSLYGEAPREETERPDDERDASEATLIDEALGRNIPLLAICRGMQILNVHLGGSLVQHLPTVARHRKRTPDKGLPAHSIAIQPGTLLASIAGRDRWQVNSRHHQGVNRLGKGLRVSATDPDDATVEAIELPEQRYVLGVQWHPENQAVADPEQRKLFQSFAAVI